MKSTFAAAAAALAVAATTFAPSAAHAAVRGCEAYTYTTASGSAGQSLCVDFGSRVSDVDCPDIGYQVTLRNRGVDPWLLDRDGDGRGCDGAGSVTKPQPTPTAPRTTAPPVTTAPATRPPTTTEPPAATARPTTAAPTTEPPATVEPTQTVPAGSGGSGPELPVTGPSAPVLAGLAAAVVLAGGGILLVARRRRTRFES
jgi:LPXTG-motif cell wall-anchored protein